jgi:hypothetical protein
MPSTDSNYAWDREYGYKPIWRFKPADRGAEVERQLSAAAEATEATCDETGLPIVDVIWVTSKFDTVTRVTRFVSHGTSVPLDGNAKEAIVVSEPGDADVRLRTLSQHMIGRIDPVIDPDAD